ncbi:MAG TPA: hypothetical protein VNP72_08630 [Longimicrobium sp.]|nr:hypothetical protein [Longimicrobium sp.]
MALAPVGILVWLAVARPAWKRRYGAETARELIRTRLVLVGFLAAAVAVVGAVPVTGDISVSALLVLPPVGVCASVSWMIWRRRRLGPVLLRMPRSRHHDGLVGFALLYLGIGAYVQVFTSGEPPVALVFVALAAFFAFLGFSPLELRTGGISSRGDAWTWSELTRYAWLDADRSQLALRFRTRWWPHSGVLPVPPDHRDRLAGILDHYAAPARADVHAA